MSRTVIITLAILVVIGIAIAAYFYFKTPQGKPLPTSNKATCASSYLFVGDSLTAYNQSYADQLTSVCPNINMKKIAQVGAKTDWMLQQLTNELQSNTYDVISIWGGVNDIYALNSIASAESNLQAMYTLANQSGAQVVALTVLPTQTYNISTTTTVNLTNQLNDWIASNSSVNAVVDVNADVNNGNNGTQSQYLQSDTLHLNAAGQAVVSADFANKVINS